MVKKLAPVHPGTVLKEDIMDELGLSANALARDLHVAPNRITEIVNGKRSVTLETAPRTLPRDVRAVLDELAECV